MAVQGCIKYKDLHSNIISEISMELLDNMLFKATVIDSNPKEPKVKFSMKDIITSNVELDGDIDVERLQVLIRNLNIIYKQLLSNQSNSTNISESIEGGCK